VKKEHFNLPFEFYRRINDKNYPEFVKQLNKETTSANFWDVVDQYRLETPEEYSYGCLCGQGGIEEEGIEVWGISDKSELLVYDDNDGWYLSLIEDWIKKVRGYIQETVNIELENLSSPEEIKQYLKKCGEDRGV
jgi:hypothetical protein